MTDPIRLALTLATLYAAHQVADHWIQTHHQACSKSAPGRTGHLACLRHVITYTITLAAGLGALALLHPLGYSPGWATAGLALKGCHRNTAETGRVRRRPQVRWWERKPGFRLWMVVPGVGPDWLPSRPHPAELVRRRLENRTEPRFCPVSVLARPVSAVFRWPPLNGATHYWADRRAPLRALAVALGKRSYWDEVPGGAYQLDQAWHHGWLWISALIIAA